MDFFNAHPWAPQTVFNGLLNRKSSAAGAVELFIVFA
jgi:hypothetical protein